jgi:hypothetical protein
MPLPAKACRGGCAPKHRLRRQQDAPFPFAMRIRLPAIGHKIHHAVWPVFLVVTGVKVLPLHLITIDVIEQLNARKAWHGIST